jgi:hypothetical protein
MMSAEKLDETTLHTVLLARLRQRPVLKCVSGICRYCSKGASAALEEREQDRPKRKGRVDFALFNIRALLNT